MDKINVDYTKNNKDDITEAVHGLDIFTKNFCMNCKETIETGEPVFNCINCEFEYGDRCYIKSFAINHEHNYPMRGFGCMGQL